MQADLVAMKDPVSNDIIFNPKVLKLKKFQAVEI